jgi:nitroreductase
MDIIESYNWRYATKEFDPTKKLTEQQLECILESLRLSASSFGLQPWKFLSIENQAIKDELVAHSWKQRQVADASHVIVLCRKKKFGSEDVQEYINSVAKSRGVENPELDGYKSMMDGFISRKSEEALAVWMNNQIYIALGHLLSTCAFMKIDSCPMEGFIAKEYDRVLKLDEKNLSSVLVCPVGFRSENDKYAQLKKVRFPKEEVIIKI